MRGLFKIAYTNSTASSADRIELHFLAMRAVTASKLRIQEKQPALTKHRQNTAPL